ncbi:MAG: sigma-70 family RNA polymerase sigma factor [Clostridia bacterium]|nr:sigma-70 family RNA polymerase sigma factor [Clostridia bacterium]
MLMDVLSDDSDGVADVVGRQLQVDRLRRLLRLLGRRELRVLALRYGLGGNSERTQREIASQLGISRSYVSRIEKRAVQKLLEAMWWAAGGADGPPG